MRDRRSEFLDLQRGGWVSSIQSFPLWLVLLKLFHMDQVDNTGTHTIFSLQEWYIFERVVNPTFGRYESARSLTLLVENGCILVADKSCYVH